MNGNLYYNKKAQWLFYIFVFIVIALIPFASDPFTLNQFSRYLIYAILAVSVSLVWGYGGILSLGQGIAFGMGAYCMAATMQMQYQDPVSDPIPSFMLTNELSELPAIWEPFWSTPVGLFLAILVPTIFFLVFGYMMFQARVAGVFVAIMTLAMLAAWYSIVYDMQPFTAGFNGITPPKAFEIFGESIDPYSERAYWICSGFLAFLTLGTKFILGTKFGLIVQSMRDDPERARFLGYSVAYYQTVLFTLSGIIAAFAGILWVMMVQYVSPTAMEISLSISMVIWAAVGGRTSLMGAIFGAILINVGQSYAGDEFQQAWLIILGVTFLLVVLFLPKGLTGLWELILEKISSKSQSTT
ncbi:MAG: urea ABC transporter permease subunit UrtC [Pseudomonadota bacterium]